MISILKRHSVLYVEDESEIRDNIAEYLSHYFAHVHLAADGSEALEKYYKHQPDVLLLDINLPSIDGLSVAHEIRKSDAAVRIIMLTAFTEKEKLLKATELKLTRYLIKPVPPKQFKETLQLLASELANVPTRFIKLSERLTWDVEQNEVKMGDVPIVLSEKEHRLLTLFINQKGETIHYDKIVATVWGDSFDRDISMDSIKNQVSQLRKKLPSARITSVYGEGYILN